MEAAVQVVAKPRVSYSAVFGQQAAKQEAVAAPQQQTVAQVLNRYVAAMALTARPVGLSASYTFKNLAAAPIGSKVAAQLTKLDVKAHCEFRLAGGVKPSTVDKDISCLGVALKYAPSAWEDCEDVSDAAIAAAKPFLLRHGLIAKSTPRTRRPTIEEIERLIVYFNRPNPWNRRRIPMDVMTVWQFYSCRRIGESCRLLWEDWNRDEQTILVRKMKDPRRRNKAKVVALPKEAQAFLIALWEIRDPDEPRILPYRAESCIAAYVAAKHATGIEGLRLHDSRRDRFTRLVEVDGYSIEEAILFSGHETINVPQKNYLAQQPALARFGPKAKRIAAELALAA